MGNASVAAPPANEIAIVRPSVDHPDPTPTAGAASGTDTNFQLLFVGAENIVAYAAVRAVSRTTIPMLTEPAELFTVAEPISLHQNDNEATLPLPVSHDMSDMSRPEICCTSPWIVGIVDPLGVLVRRKE